MQYKITTTDNIKQDIIYSLTSNSIDDSVKFYGVSVPTISRWKADKIKIPLWTERAYSYYLRALALEKKMEEDRRELVELKDTISLYFESQNKLKDFIS